MDTFGSAADARDAAIDAFEEYAQSVTELMCSSLEHIPVVKAIDALARTAVSVRDFILQRKVLSYLTALKDAPPDQLRAMVTRLESDPAYGRKVGQHVVEILDRVDSHRKPAMIGAVFAAFANQKINAMMLQQLIMSIERLPVFRISLVRRFAGRAETDGMDNDARQALFNAGFVILGSVATYGGGGLTYMPNEVCRTFVEINLDLIVA